MRNHPLLFAAALLAQLPPKKSSRPSKDFSQYENARGARLWSARRWAAPGTFAFSADAVPHRPQRPAGHGRGPMWFYAPDHHYWRKKNGTPA
jgi:hypothetical protein